MRLLPLRSSMIANAGYDPATETLVIQFNNGGLYRYDGVPSDVFVSFITDEESHGKNFTEHIKSRSFPYKKIEPDELEGL